MTVRLERVDAGNEGKVETIRARYVVGCDGARSTVRKSIGRELHGDSANHAWGVMDVLAVTDFPDIRFKALIQSAKDGSLLIIPREGGYMVRLYVELAKLDVGERVANRNITADDVIAKAQRILKPHTLDVKEIAWWSVYEIGQRLTDKFDDVPEAEIASRLPRIFIAGDACHTHSPKAGQGMNVSMQDAFNLGWKLAAVLRGQCAPRLLHSYSAERQAVAKELIDFDREWAGILASAAKAGGADAARRRTISSGTGAIPRARRRITGRRSSLARQHTSILPKASSSARASIPRRLSGLRMPSRFISAMPRRPMAASASTPFPPAEDPAAAGSAIRALCDFLAEARESPVRRHTPAGADIDSVIDLRAVFQQDHRALAVEAMPALLLPRKGRHGLIDYEKMFCPDLKSGQDVFTMRGIDRRAGCIVVVRPDQYVAQVLPIDAFSALAAYFDAFMLQADVSAGAAAPRFR